MKNREKMPSNTKPPMCFGEDIVEEMSNSSINHGLNTNKIPGLIQIEDLPSPKEYDKQKFQDVLYLQKGSRSMRQFSMDTGVSESFISKAITGKIESTPSKRTMIRLLHDRVEELVNWRELLNSSGYSEKEINWDDISSRDAVSDKNNASVGYLIQHYATSLYVSCGELMAALATQGAEKDFSCSVNYSEGYYEIQDRVGNKFIGINCCSNPNESSTPYLLVLAASLTHERISAKEDSGDKIIYIITNDPQVFDALCVGPLSRKSKATITLLTDAHGGIMKETFLHGAERVAVRLIK